MENWQAKLNMHKTGVTEAVQTLAEALNLLPLTAALLYERGLDTPEKARAFLSESDRFCDPFLLPDMEKAANRLVKAIQNGEPIVIYGDYDVDGVTSTALLILYLRSKGLSPAHYIPSRAEEGYGMSCEVIDRLAAEGNTLIVTVDTGVTALDEAVHCREIGVDLVVTDHHECRETLPDALAVVNPRRNDSHYPCPHLAGVGVAFKLITACELLLTGQTAPDAPLPAICEELVDLAALGTVADVMPLVGENRRIVRMGLRRMAKHPRPAITALLAEAAAENGGSPAEMSAATIAFTIAPRINAAGRMAHADRALALFLSPVGEANAHAKELCALNRQRQSEENRLLELAEKQLAAKGDGAPAILLWGEQFNSGIIGIVAARLAERYQKPTFLISFEGDIGKGSGRSAAGIDLVKLLEGCGDLLVKYGGHSQAAGLTVERTHIGAFAERFMSLTALAATAEAPPRLYDIDVSPAQLTLRQAEELALLEPYGAGNPQPLFCLKNMTIEQVTPMGERHTRLYCSGDALTHQVLMFGQPRDGLDLFKGDKVDLLVELSLNRFRGTTSIGLICRGRQLSDSSVSEEEAALCRDLLRPIPIDIANPDEWQVHLSADDIPTRDDCGALYRYLRAAIGFGRRELTSLRKLTAETNGHMTMTKLTLTLRLLSDAGLLCIVGNDPMTLLLPHTEGKVDLTALPLYRFLHSLHTANSAEH